MACERGPSQLEAYVSVLHSVRPGMEEETILRLLRGTRVRNRMEVLAGAVA